jgi:hypothetical protein
MFQDVIIVIYTYPLICTTPRYKGAENNTESPPTSLFTMFSDSAEYIERTKQPFVPPNLDYAVLRKALPDNVWKRSTTKSLIAFGRLIVISALLHRLGLWLVHGATLPSEFPYASHPIGHMAAKVAGWAFYLWWQPLAWAGFWALGKQYRGLRAATHLTMLPTCRTRCALFPLMVHSPRLILYDCRLTTEMCHKYTG